MPKETNKSYLAKDFTSLRADLLNYARSYFSDQIRDFSEASMGGLLLDMAAYVGDTMSFYLDYQFKELNPMTAIESQNIVNHAKNAGVDIVGAAPATVEVTFKIQVGAKQKPDGSYHPNPAQLPIIKALNTVLISSNGITFTLESDLNFGEKNDDNILLAAYRVFSQTSTGAPGVYTCSRKALCMSGKTVVEKFDIANIAKPFRKITLTNSDVSEILSVKDSQNNHYHKVESLTQNVIYRRVKNIDENKDVVESNFEILPAPYRFTKATDFNTRLTTLQFGSGDADSLDDDILPDPSQLALPLYGKKVFSRFSIDPNALMKTKTLGISPKNTILEVLYRFGGGLNHNVQAGTIKNISTINIIYPGALDSTLASSTVDSMAVNNFEAAGGGAPALTLADLKTQISSARNQQSRIVTQQDLLARIYTMPNNFGRVVRAGLKKDERNPLATQLFVISQDSQGKMRVAPDALKKNLRKYINEFRLISDAIDVLDGIIINYGVEFTLITHPHANKALVVSKVLSKLQKISQIKYFQIDQPLVEADIINAIISTDGVLSLVNLNIVNYSGARLGNQYSDYALDMAKNKFKGLYVGPPGSIFELRYPGSDLIGNAE